MLQCVPILSSFRSHPQLWAKNPHILESFPLCRCFFLSNLDSLNLIEFNDSFLTHVLFLYLSFEPPGFPGLLLKH